MHRTSVIAVALISAFALGTGAALAKPGKGRGGPPPHAGNSGWTDGVAPGFSSPGLRRGWIDGRPPGWSRGRGRKRGWDGYRVPPGWRNR